MEARHATAPPTPHTQQHKSYLFIKHSWTRKKGRSGDYSERNQCHLTR